MRTLIRNRHGRPLLSRISFTRALRKTRPCSASHHLSKNAQKMANDWFIIHQSLCENKRPKNTGWRGEWTESSGHFYGLLRAVQGIRGLSHTSGYGRFRGKWVNKGTLLQSVPLYSASLFHHKIIVTHSVLLTWL